MENKISLSVFLLVAAYVCTEQLALFRGAWAAVSCFLPVASSQPPAARNVLWQSVTAKLRTPSSVWPQTLLLPL